MCGIAGVFGSKDIRLIKSLIEILHHRGPDDVGYHTYHDLHLGMCRLSIIDLQSGGQPIYNETRDKCVVFNGEIYNYRELRQQLRDKGHLFHTDSDTEVIIHLYEEYSYQCVDHLRGMFAFAIADGNKLFLARDRLGIKPLYYTFLREEGIFLFASEIKALLQCKEVNVAIDVQTLADRAVLGYAVGSHTYFQHIKSFQPGHIMMVTNEKGFIEVEEQKYYHLSLAPNSCISLNDAQEKLTGILHSTVKSHLISDVDIGLTLSGGLDSSLLAVIMNEHYRKNISMFTIADHEDYSDIALSKVAACGTASSHEIIIMTFSDYLNMIPGCIAAEEQPSSLFALPFYYLCQTMNQKVKVCFNGEGADEVFGGYQEYLHRFSKTSYMIKKLAKLKKFGITPRTEVLKIIDGLLSPKTFDEYLQQVFIVNLQDQLVRQHLEIVDKYAMAASLEIRVPYMDHELVEFVNTLPLHFKVDQNQGISKYILKKIALDRYGSQLMDIPLQKKIGLPSSGMQYQACLDVLCENLLSEVYLNSHPFGSYFQKKRDLLVFELFLEIFMHQRGRIPETFNLADFIKERASSIPTC